jgi:hypothetical protein
MMYQREMVISQSAVTQVVLMYIKNDDISIVREYARPVSMTFQIKRRRMSYSYHTHEQGRENTPKAAKIAERVSFKMSRFKWWSRSARERWFVEGWKMRRLCELHGEERVCASTRLSLRKHSNIVVSSRRTELRSDLRNGTDRPWPSPPGFLPRFLAHAPRTPVGIWSA